MELVSSVLGLLALLVTAGTLMVGIYQLRQERKLAAGRAEQERKLAARRATLDLVMNQAHDPTRPNLRLKFESLMMNWKPGGNGLNDLSQAVRLETVAYLNRFELVGVAIKHKAIDEEMYKAWSCSRYVYTWKTAEKIIMETRKCQKRTDLYCEFEELAREWAKDAL